MPVKFKSKIRLRKRDSGTQVLALVLHPMHDGQQFNAKTGQIIPAHYIELMVFEVNDRPMAEIQLGPYVSKNPLVTVTVNDIKAGDRVGYRWKDNLGHQGGTATVAA
jgi:sulfur-oxidizing protein SoxZ